MLLMRLDGMTYQAIAIKAGISRQRVQQLLGPVPATRRFVVRKFGGRCNRCGIYVGKSGHVHHNGDLDVENYDDPHSLELLCIGCHRIAHLPEPYLRRRRYKG